MLMGLWLYGVGFGVYYLLFFKASVFIEEANLVGSLDELRKGVFSYFKLIILFNLSSYRKALHYQCSGNAGWD